MRNLRRLAVLVLGLALLATAASPSSAGDFPLKDGDIWVMAGDSITAQHLHSNYFEAFCYARYPRLKFAFRNSGVGGHTIPSTLARFDYDIAAWKPTVVSVELGMNDKGRTPTEKFITNMDTMVERIRSIKARPVIFAASPVNNGETLASLKSNKRLDEYATALKELAAKEKIPYADQFHALVDIWGKNRAPGNSDAVALLGDPVHPGAPGQLMMAAALLKALDAEGFVSSATVDASGKVVQSKGCTISEVKKENGKLAFVRQDDCLPFPIPDNARTVLPLYPTILDLSQYTLKVTGLEESMYALTINGAAVAMISAKDLEAGVNLTAFGPIAKAKEINPIVAQSRAVLNAVSAKERLVSQWRGLSKMAHATGAAPELKDRLTEMTRKVEEADEKIRAAAKPQKLQIELAPAP